MSQDILDLLLPDAARGDLDYARRITLALRLFLHAGSGNRAESVEASVDGARSELEIYARRQRSEALQTLIRRHLEAHLDPGSFLLWGPPESSSPERPAEEAWQKVLEGTKAPSLPAPGEPPLAVATRLLADLARVDPDGEGTAVWSARLRHTAEGPAAGEAAFRGLLAAARGPFGVRRAGVAGVAACLLSRGHVEAARAWLAEHLDLAAADQELAWHLVWCELGLGKVEVARETARGLQPHAGVLPRVLAELRRRHPAWIQLLPGREPPADRTPPVPSREHRHLEREDLGASLVAVFALGPANEALIVDLQSPPALLPAAEAWARSRVEAPGDLTAPEHALVAAAEPLIRDRAAATVGDERPLTGVFDSGTRTQVLLPVHFDTGTLEGEVAGWIALELPHHLAPDRLRAEALIERWRRRVLQQAWSRRGVAAELKPVLLTPLAPEREDPSADAARSFIDSLGMKTAQRRWWFFDLNSEGPELVAQGGGALADRRSTPGRGRALGRALATGGTIHFDAPDPRLALHAAAASGIVLPLRGPRGVVGLLVIESLRRADFKKRDRARLAASVAGFHDAWVGTRFATWHQERFGEEVLIDAATGIPLHADDALAAGRARMPAAIVGPAGVGRRVAARWLHFEGGAGLPLRSLYVGGTPGTRGYRHRGSTGEADGARDSNLAHATSGDGTRILDGLELSDLAWQAQLEQRLDPGGPRILALLRTPPAALVASGGLRPGLGARLGRLVVVVPPLRARRNAIPGLVEVLARRVAREEGLETPIFSDEAMACLWRQPWGENVRELESLVARAVLLFPGLAVGAPELAAAAERLGLRLQRRLPSRHPAREDLVAALVGTRCLSGGSNKTRAATYLGWDPDTLVARMRDARIDPQDLPGPTRWVRRRAKE